MFDVGDADEKFFTSSQDCQYSGLDVVFAEGPDAGWEKMQRVRGAGSCSIREMVETLCDYEIVIPDELCFPTLMSGVLALDFDQMMMVRLKNIRL